MGKGREIPSGRFQTALATNGPPSCRSFATVHRRPYLRSQLFVIRQPVGLAEVKAEPWRKRLFEPHDRINDCGPRESFIAHLGRASL